jgi:putative restriction endonuclease
MNSSPALPHFASTLKLIAAERSIPLAVSQSRRAANSAERGILEFGIKNQFAEWMCIERFCGRIRRGFFQLRCRLECSGVSAATRVPWSYDDLVIACGLYFTLPFGLMHARNPKIIKIAHLLGRTPSSLAMKLVNFASLDPQQRARGIRGLASHSRIDEQVWNEFNNNWAEMSLRSEAGLASLQARRAEPGAEVDSRYFQEEVQTEVARRVRVRTMQGFFRKVVLAAYVSKCCITGNPVEDLLVASHILPWVDFPEERLNPRNGICLAAHFDRAFDRGLITFDDRMRVILSPILKRYAPNEAIESDFLRREGQPLVLPERFPPQPDFLTYHRNRIFRTV